MKKRCEPSAAVVNVLVKIKTNIGEVFIGASDRNKTAAKDQHWNA